MEQKTNKSKLKIIIPIAIVIIAIVGIVAVIGNNNSNNKGSNNKVSKATITDNNGIETSMSAQELMDIYDSNEANFKKNYAGANIEFTGTIKKIKTNTHVIADDGRVTSEQNVIFFEEGWALVIGKCDSMDLSNYEKGEKLKVKTGIIGSPFSTDYVKQVCENERVVWLAGRAHLFNTTYSGQELKSNYSYYIESTQKTTIERVK